MSTFSDKYVDFEITSESSPGTASSLLPQKSGAPAEQHDQLEDLVFKVSGQLSTVNRMQKYFRTRENRNFSTVRSTEKRILQFSMIEVAMMVGMALLQVLVVRFFFQGARKGEYCSENLAESAGAALLNCNTDMMPQVTCDGLCAAWPPGAIYDRGHRACIMKRTQACWWSGMAGHGVETDAVDSCRSRVTNINDVPSIVLSRSCCSKRNDAFGVVSR